VAAVRAARCLWAGLIPASTEEAWLV
jgi:hypothetical protein